MKKVIAFLWGVAVASLIIAAAVRYLSYTGSLCPAPKTSSEIIDSITKIQNDLSEAQKIVKEGIRR